MYTDYPPPPRQVLPKELGRYLRSAEYNNLGLILNLCIVKRSVCALLETEKSDDPFSIILKQIAKLFPSNRGSHTSFAK